MLPKVVAMMFVFGLVAGLVAFAIVQNDRSDPGDATARSGESRQLAPRDAAIEYLFSQRQPDRLWHSPNYGNLREGAAITSLVLYTLSKYKSEITSEQLSQLRESSSKLVDGIDERGYVTNPGGPDYSNYASAMLLVANRRLGVLLPENTRQKLVAYLIDAQLDESQGFHEGKNPDYGGWDLSGWMKGERQTTGTNISVSSFVLEALSEEESSVSLDACLDRAATWIAGCRSEDGGFFFHPKRDHDGNKAGWNDDSRNQPKPYGSTTADGIYCSSVLGNRVPDGWLSAGVKWIEKHPDVERVPGFEHETTPGTWAIGLKFYYWHALSRSLESFPGDQQKTIAEQIEQSLLACQSDNGSWSNENARMREDDPIIATCFALSTLANIERYLQQ